MAEVEGVQTGTSHQPSEMIRLHHFGSASVGTILKRKSATFRFDAPIRKLRFHELEGLELLLPTLPLEPAAGIALSPERIKMKRKRKTRFINLAEQLSLQNDVVSSTMDSMLQFVSKEETVEERSDFTEIQKTAQQICEMNPEIDSNPSNNPDLIDTRRGTSLPRPKMTIRRSLNQDKVEN